MFGSCSLEALWVQDDSSTDVDSVLTDQLDSLLRTRLSRPDEAAALQSLLQQTMSDDGQPMVVLKVRRGVVELTLPGQFQVGLTVRAAQGPWILCWANILVREHAAAADDHHTRWISPFLRAHLQGGASLRVVLNILQHFCLKLQLTMLRTQAVHLQRGRLSNAIAVDDKSMDDASDFTVSYWDVSASSVHSTGCKIRISLQGRQNSKALRIHHSPALVSAGRPQDATPAGAESTDQTQRILPGQVNFEKLLVATMQTRAAMRIDRVACTLSARIKAVTTSAPGSSAKPRPCVQIADKTDSAGYPYVDVALPSARLELHVRRDTGLLQLYQADGWRHEQVLAPWQAQLDQGSGIVEDASSTINSIGDMFISTHRRLLLESIIDRARACGARVETPRFQSKAHVGHDLTEGNVFNSADEYTTNRGYGYKAFIRIAAASLDEYTSYQQPQQQRHRLAHEQFYLAIWVGDNDDDDAFRSCLGAFAVPSQNAQDGLELSTILQMDMDARSDVATTESTIPSFTRSGSKRKWKAVSHGPGPSNLGTSACPDGVVQFRCPSSGGDNDVFHSVDVVLERASSAVMAHCLRQALKCVGLQHVWTSQFQARVALPSASTEPVTIRVLPSMKMQWQCQIGLPPAPPELIKTLIPKAPIELHRSDDMLSYDGSQVYLRYGGGHMSCRLELLSLCADVLRITHMAELCYSLHETLRSAAVGSDCLQVRCLSLREVVIECLDAASTTITIDTDIRSAEINAATYDRGHHRGKSSGDDVQHSNGVQTGQSEAWEKAVTQAPSPRLRVTFDPNPATCLHFCASFFPPAVYRVVGVSAQVEHRVKPRSNSASVPSGTRSLSLAQSATDAWPELIRVADVRSCARFLCEQDKSPVHRN